MHMLFSLKTKICSYDLSIESAVAASHFYLSFWFHILIVCGSNIRKNFQYSFKVNRRSVWVENCEFLSNEYFKSIEYSFERDL